MGVLEILEGGMYTTVQDYPGRVGYWNVGIPPSGPMDSFSFRCANWLVGNRPSEAGLEVTMTGPTICFHADTIFSLCGAELEADLNGKPVSWWQAITATRGSVLTLGKIAGYGSRSYIAFQNGLVIDAYLGSKSTFPKGQFGGFHGRPITRGDLLKVTEGPIDENRNYYADKRQIAELTDHWVIGAVPGPYAAPDYFLDEDVTALYASELTVHYNSNRLGYRLIGPKPKFARKDGGEGGRHPSNLHDYVYGIGTVNFTGDMPIVIGVDGPSLGGFTSMVTIPDAEFWKIGQSKAGDKIRFERWSVKKAVRARLYAQKSFKHSWNTQY
jgi:urea carboxylase